VQLNINNGSQFFALLEALGQYTSNQRAHLEEEAEEGTRDDELWRRLEDAERYLETLERALAGDSRK
jgi:hypothetical protein